MNDDTEIEDNKLYTISSNDFLFQSYGDDMSNIQRKIQLFDVKIVGAHNVLSTDYLRKKDTINVLDYYNPKNPRYYEGKKQYYLILMRKQRLILHVI